MMTANSIKIANLTYVPYGLGIPVVPPETADTTQATAMANTVRLFVIILRTPRGSLTTSRRSTAMRRIVINEFWTQTHIEMLMDHRSKGFDVILAWKAYVQLVMPVTKSEKERLVMKHVLDRLNLFNGSKKVTSRSVPFVRIERIPMRNTDMSAPS